MTEAITIRDLTVRYGSFTAVDAVDLSVESGEVLALLGRNGAGKSSLVRCLLGLQKPDRGRAKILGRPIWESRADVLQRVGVVPETPDAPPGTTAAQLGRFSRQIFRTWNGAGYAQRLERFDIPTRIPFGRLSRGQKAIVQLALALAPEPEVLVLDDPTLGLDAVARRFIFEEVVGELADRETTVFITSHDLVGIEGVASRVAVIVNGRMQVDEPIEQLKARFRRIRVDGQVDRSQLEALAPVAVESGGLGTSLVFDRHDNEVLDSVRLATGSGRVEAVPMSLEEIFVAVTGGDDLDKKETGR